MLLEMFAAPFIVAALLVAFVLVPMLQRRSTPHAKQKRRMEQARAEYQRTLNS